MSNRIWLTKLKKYLSLITIEPTMVLYMMAFMTTTVVEQAFFVDKACRVDHKFNDTICGNISAKENEDYNKIVQITVSNFHQWNNISGHAFPIILALFMGAWSDKRGRKLPLILGLIGKLYYSSMIILNATQPSWPLMYVVYTATLPMAFTGADVAIFSAAFAYISDVSSKENRTLRVTLLEVCYLATMPSGIALGSYLFTKVTGRSFALMFTINASLLIFCIIYTVFRLKWRTNDKQKPLSEAPNKIKDFFDINHMTSTFKMLYKKREARRRTYLLLLILAMACYTFQRDEKQMSYSYLQLVMNWPFEKISTFRSYQSALQDVILLMAIPLLSKVCKWKDGYIIMLGALAHSIARIFYANASVSWVFYVGGVFASFGPVVAPVIRSMLSKLVSVEERGKAFAVLSVADNAIPLVSSTLYSQLYNATIHTHPNSIYYLTICTQMVVFFIIVFVHCTSSEKSLNNEADEVKEHCLQSENIEEVQEENFR